MNTVINTIPGQRRGEDGISGDWSTSPVATGATATAVSAGEASSVQGNGSAAGGPMGAESTGSDGDWTVSLGKKSTAVKPQPGAATVSRAPSILEMQVST